MASGLTRFTTFRGFSQTPVTREGQVSTCHCLGRRPKTNHSTSGAWPLPAAGAMLRKSGATGRPDLRRAVLGKLRSSGRETALPSETGLQVNDELWLPETELNFSADRGGGPGGQHVNKVSTRVSLVFDVAALPTLDERQKQRIRTRLAGRVSRAGLLRVSSRKFRSQHANRQAARERLRELLAWALAETPERLPTRPTAAARRRRLEEKSRLSRRKAGRTKTFGPEDEG